MAEAHLGRLEWHADGDKVTPGKVAHVGMLLPNVIWSHTYRDPWTGKPRMP